MYHGESSTDIVLYIKSNVFILLLIYSHTIHSTKPFLNQHPPHYVYICLKQETSNRNNYNSLNMPLTSSRTTAAPRTTRSTRSTAHPSLKSKLLGGGTNRRTATKRNPVTGTTTTTTTTKTTRTTGGRTTGARTTAAPVHHHKRHATVGDKVSGALTKLKGTLTGRPGVKAAGTRRMHGTDGRGARHVY